MDVALFAMILVFGTILGLVVGSFLNVVIHRVPRGESIVHPPSHCPSCDRRIRWYENIPVLSFLFLGGKCHGCKAKIAWRYPAVELAGGLVVLISLLAFGLSWKALAGIIMGWNLIALGVIDLETKTVPDILVLFLGIPGLVLAFLGGSWHGFGMAVLSAAIMGGFFWLTRKVASSIMDQEAMGEGDITLVIAISVYLQPMYLPFFLLLSSVSVLFAAVVWAQVKRISLHETEIPFGPGLALGGWITYITGFSIIEYLMRLF